MPNIIKETQPCLKFRLLDHDHDSLQRHEFFLVLLKQETYIL